MYTKKTNDGEEIIRFKMPFDLRHENPSKNYGIHGLDMWFIFKKNNKAVQFMLCFNSYLKSVSSSHGGDIMAYDIGYHSDIPMWEGQSSNDCDLLDGGKCYYDGSSLYAPTIWDELQEKAVGNKDFNIEKEIFIKLREYWDNTFTDRKE